MRFDDKVVLVTGASRGIGREIALQFSRRGATVVAHYHQNRAAALETLAAMPGAGHFIVQADMADASAVQAMAQTVAKQFGRIDILVNNAGIYEEHLLTEVDYEGWQAQFQRALAVNLIGAANATYCAAQVMLRQGGGRIVNVSSRGAFRG